MVQIKPCIVQIYFGNQHCVKFKANYSYELHAQGDKWWYDTCIKFDQLVSNKIKKLYLLELGSTCVGIILGLNTLLPKVIMF